MKLRTSRPGAWRELSRSALALALVCAPAFGSEAAPAQTTSDPATLDTVQVSATRLQGVPAFATPASISVIELDGQQNRALAQTSEALVGVPGLLARDRQNLAQDTQLSLRGFGARSTFGVRGVRLYADAIPATLPDGQGQLSHFNLLGAERIEILRGPFSALYGNSAGGVVLLHSAGSSDAFEARLRASVASHGSIQRGMRLRGGLAGAALGYSLAATHFDTTGFRAHSAARRTSVNLLLDLGRDADRKWRVVVNHFDAPDAQDPLGLTREQAQADPRQAPLARQFNTRKSTRQEQAGLIGEIALGTGQHLQLKGYGGQRTVAQFLAIPPTAQGNPLHAGGVVDLATDYGGAELRWSWSGTLAGRALEWSLGSSLERMHQHRRGYENFVGTLLGVRGALRRDERNRVRSVDQYTQVHWQWEPWLSLLVGARHSALRFAADDHYITASNPDDSGSVRYREWTPVLGFAVHLQEHWNLYLASGRGFETPTFNELGYRADGGAGLAFDLNPARSRNLELGSKWHSEAGLRLEAALFRADTDDEIAVARNVGGRSSFRNVGRARRQGAELALLLPIADAWSAELAYTRLDARFRDTFPICTAAGCTTPTTQVTAGTRVPGVARDQLYARMQWQRGAWTAAAEAVAVADVSVNDPGSARASGHGLLHLELARRFHTLAGPVRAFLRMDNVLDQAYIGSVIVNEGNSRFYEPGPGRTLLLGAQWDWLP